MKVYGRNTFGEIKDKSKIKKVYLTKYFNDTQIKKQIIKYNIDCQLIDKTMLKQFNNVNHQGIIMEIDDYQYADIDSFYDADIVVILDHLEDNHNFGAIIRTCEAAGIKNIVIPNKRSVGVNPTVYKTSSGAVDNVCIAQVTNIVNTINKFKENNFFIYGTDMNGVSYKEVDYANKVVLIIGNEAKGISLLVKQNCDELVSIPMAGKVNSLNASVAAGVVIFDLVNRG